MAVLAPPIHIKAKAGAGACVRYIQDPLKITADGQTKNVMRYMQSHCIEEVASVGYNGCSGVCELAVEQFRLAEARYRATHKVREYKDQEFSVLKYLETHHKSKLPKKLKPIAPKDRQCDMSLEDALRIWNDKSQSKDDKEAAKEVLEAYTIVQKAKSPTLAEHLVISAHRKDNPSPEQLYAIAEKFMSHPEMRNHLAVGNIHFNTDEKHIHLLVSNYDKSGQQCLSLSGSKLRRMRRYLDKLCYEQGLSIIDTREARMDPEHAKWIDEVKAEGKIKVWSEKETKAAKGKANWKVNHDLKVAALSERIDANPKLIPMVKEDLKDIARNDLFAGDGKHINYTIRSMTLEEIQALAREERRRRTKKSEEEARRRRRDEPQWRRLYTVRVYVYDEFLHRYRQRSVIEMLYILARLIITGETKFMEENYPSKYSDFEAVLNSPTAWKIQNMIDSVKICQDLNIRTPAEMDRRVEDIGQKIGASRRAIAMHERMLERGGPVYQAVQDWRNKSLPEETRKKAYATLAHYGCKTEDEMDKVVWRYETAQRELPGEKQHLEELTKDYRNAKRAQNSINSMAYDCQHYSSAAREMAKSKPEFEAQVKKAQNKKDDQRREVNERLDRTEDIPIS